MTRARSPNDVDYRRTNDAIDIAADRLLESANSRVRVLTAEEAKAAGYLVSPDYASKTREAPKPRKANIRFSRATSAYDARGK